MTTKLIKIGNSKGIRIPKHILQGIGLKDEVEIEVKDDRIILKAVSKIRDNWEIAFQKMSKSNDDILFDKEYLENSNFWDNEDGSGKCNFKDLKFIKRITIPTKPYKIK